MNDSNGDINTHLQELIDSVDELMVMKDGQGRWLAANRVARTIFQLSYIDYRGKTDAELAARVPAMCSLLPFMADNDDRAWAAGKPVLLERSFTDPAGRPVLWELAFTPHFDDQGRPARLTIVSRNVNERKRIEAELRQSEERYRLIADHMSDVIGMTDPTGRVTYVSPSVATVLGYSPRNLLGVDIRHVVHEEDKVRFNTALAKFDCGG